MYNKTISYFNTWILDFGLNTTSPAGLRVLASLIVMLFSLSLFFERFISYFKSHNEFNSKHCKLNYEKQQE